MKTLDKILSGLEFAQVGWVVKDIHAAVDFFATAMGMVTFPPPEKVHAEAIGLSYYGKVVPAEWRTTQTYHNHTFIELIQPLSGQSIFGDYLDRHPEGGIQHLAYRLPVADFDKACNNLIKQGYSIITGVDHPIARISFFDTYDIFGIAIEIMGITPEGWKTIRQMEK